MKVLGSESNPDLVYTGFGLGLLSSVLIFYTDSSLAQNFLGFVTGSGFSPAFITERTDSGRYFVLGFVFNTYLFLILAGFRWPLIISMFVLALSAYSEARTNNFREKKGRQKMKFQS